MTKELHAQEAYDLAPKQSETPAVNQSFICAYADCRSYSRHIWARPFQANIGGSGNQIRYVSANQPIVLALCEACQRETLFVAGVLVHPLSINAPAAAADMPADVARDFEEARTIVRTSPRGAAALLRLAVEKLCQEIGTTKKDINGAIGELVSTGRIAPMVQQALDTVRVIGNEAVHPGHLDLRDDEATVNALFSLINLIVHKTITEPKEVKAIFDSLPQQKLDGIAQRDAPKAPAPVSAPKTT